MVDQPRFMCISSPDEHFYAFVYIRRLLFMESKYMLLHGLNGYCYTISVNSIASRLP